MRRGEPPGITPEDAQPVIERQQIDAPLILSALYTPQTIFVGPIEKIVKNGEASILAKFEAHPSFHRQQPEVAYLNAFYAKPDGTFITSRLVTTNDHAYGHFREEVVAGHESINFATKTKEYYERLRNRPDISLRLAHLDGATFGGIIRPGHIIDTIIRPEEESLWAIPGDHVIIRGVHKTHKDTPEVTLRNMITIVSRIPPEETLRADQLIEGAAQAAGVIALDGKSLDELGVLFGGIGEATFPGIVRDGDTVIYRVQNLREEKRGIKADTKITAFRRGGLREEPIGDIKDISIAVMQRKTLERMLKAA